MLVSVSVPTKYYSIDASYRKDDISILIEMLKRFYLQGVVRKEVWIQDTPA